MIIYGTGSTKIKEHDLFNKCSHCNNNTLKAFVYSKYVSVFWIPVFPINKYVATQCSHCNQVLQEKQMPDDLKQTALAIKRESKKSIKSFSGLIMLGSLFIFIAFIGITSGENTKKYALKPMQGDRYFYKTNEGNFSSMKLAKMGGGDSISFFLNDFTVAKQRNINTIDESKNYDTTAYYTYSKNELDSMLNSKKIFQITR